MVILPRAPNTLEKTSYQNRDRILFYLPGLISMVTLLTGLWYFTLAHEAFYIFFPFALLMSFYLSLSFVIGSLGKDFPFHLHAARVHHYKKAALFPTIDVYLPCCGEHIDVLRNTYEHVRKLEWPGGKLKIHVLDDKFDLNVQSLALSKGFNYISRPNAGELKKAGNLRYAFTKTEGDYFVVFDADFCPRPDFLYETMPYMTGEVAIVQTPQYFTVLENQTWVEKGAGFIQELFYRMVQVSRDRWAAAICVGSNAIYRRKALEPFGGTAPIAYSEDVHTGFMVTDAGWRVRYVPLCLAKGVCPPDVKSFFVQQYRWGLGSLTLFMNRKFWSSNLTHMQKLCYLSGMMFYMAAGMGVIFTILPGLLLVTCYPDLVRYYNVIFSLPSFIFGLMILKFWTKQPFGVYALKAKAIANHAYLFALYDKVFGYIVPWEASGAVGKVKRFDHFKEFCFYWNLISLCLLYFAAGIQFNRIQHFIPTLFFATFYGWLNLSVLKDNDWNNDKPKGAPDAQ
jgi:cellulose synthase/poly-beta-1,6-N-acetylglucosamine synthase-like glycosyltransferase